MLHVPFFGLKSLKNKINLNCKIYFFTPRASDTSGAKFEKENLKFSNIFFSSKTRVEKQRPQSTEF